MNIQLFDYSVNLTQALLWQYNDATSLQTLINDKQLWYDVNFSEFWESWFINVFNLETANDFGCFVWAIILDVPLQIDIGGDEPGKPLWGFGPIGNDNQNFEHGNFSNLGIPIYELTTEEKRLVLLMRYFKLTSRAAIPEINRYLNRLFSSYGPIYLLDGLNMTIKLIYGFAASSRLRYIIEHYDLIPRGAGVGIDYFVATDLIFGFGPSGNGNQNFEHGCFIGRY